MGIATLNHTIVYILFVFDRKKVSKSGDLRRG